MKHIIQFILMIHALEYHNKIIQFIYMIDLLQHKQLTPKFKIKLILIVHFCNKCFKLLFFCMNLSYFIDQLSLSKYIRKYITYYFLYIQFLILMILILVIVAIAFLILWVVYLKGFLLYLRAARAFGRQNVQYICHPLTSFIKLHKRNTDQFNHSFQPFFRSLAKNPHTKIIVYHTFLFNVFILLDPQLIKQLAIKHNYSLSKNKHMLFINDVLYGITHSVNEKWKRSRKLMSNLFHYDILKKNQEVVLDIVQKYTKNLDNRSQDIDLYRQIGNKIAAFSVIAIMFGNQFNQIKFDGRFLYEQVQNLILETIKETRKLSFFLRRRVLGNFENKSYLLTKSEKQVLRRIKKFKATCREYLEKQYKKYENKQTLPPFLNAYFQHKDQFEDVYNQMIGQLIIFLFAGQDTTSLALIQCLYQLGENPDIQQSLRKEITGLSNQNIHACKNLNNFIHQCLRLNTPAPNTLMRMVDQQFFLGNKLKLKKQEIITVGLILNNRNPKYFDEPEKFDPDRFNKIIQNNAYMPFYTGPRNCIGQHLAMLELRLTLREILKQYKVERNQTNLKMLIGGFVFNRPENYRLVKFKSL